MQGTFLGKVWFYCSPFHLFFFFFNIYLFHWTGSSLWHVGSSHWGTKDLVPWPGIKFRPPTLGAQDLSHWTTREVPPLSSFTPNISILKHCTLWPLPLFLAPPISHPCRNMQCADTTFSMCLCHLVSSPLPPATLITQLASRCHIRITSSLNSQLLWQNSTPSFFQLSSISVVVHELTAENSWSCWKASLLMYDHISQHPYWLFLPWGLFFHQIVNGLLHYLV